MIAQNSRLRIELQTNESVNARLKSELKQRYDYYDAHRDEIERRLEELDREWDVERSMFLWGAFATFVFVWFNIKSLQYFASCMMALHALQGCCPPLPVFRFLGFRTLSEINDERYALMSMRGDFGGHPKSAEQVFDKSMMAKRPVVQS